MAPPELAHSLPYVTPDLPGIGGRLRLSPEAFVVTEVPLYEASGEGPHLYITLTKANLTTRDVEQRLERLLGLPRGSVGYAGMKDKAALARQTFSVPVNAPPERDPELVDRIAAALPVTIHEARRHRNKLKLGHLLGNHFQITVHSPECEPDTCEMRATAIAQQLRARGVPNYFGPQRFGIRGDNAVAGYEILGGRRRERDRWKRQLLISSYQSYLCNRYLALRVERGQFGMLLRGDIAKKHDTGGLFEVADADVEQPRFLAGEISFTAPMFGAKMRRACCESGELEAAVEAETGLTDEAWSKTNTEGTRRLGRLLVPALRLAAHPDRLTLDFFLPKGGFATTVLREFMKSPPEALEVVAEEGGDGEI